MLYIRYSPADMKGAKKPGPEAPPSLWRYADVLPEITPVSLSEGWTAMLASRRHPGLRIKDEARNPTGSFQARGMALAISMAGHRGLRELSATLEPGAATALAAYSAAAGIGLQVFAPRNHARENYLEALAYGAQVMLADGPVFDRSAGATEDATADGWELTEPYRLEGLKTLGYELVEQMGWRYPEAVLCPLGGDGLIAMWKAFEEMEQMGWVSGRRPRMIAVVRDHGNPAGIAGEASGSELKNGSLVQEIVRESGGSVVEVPEDARNAAFLNCARHEGVLLCPEGAAAAAAYELLLARDALRRSDEVVAFNPSRAQTEAIVEAMRLTKLRTQKYPQRMAVGGIITPA